MGGRMASLLVVASIALVGCGARGSEPTVPDPTTSSTTPTTVVDHGNDADQAVAAAVRFVCSGQELLDTPPALLADAIRGMWSASSAEMAVSDTVDQLVELREQLSAGQGPTRYRQSVIATRVDRSSAIETTVSVWWVGVLSRDGAATPQAQWSTSSVSLILEDGDWKVTAQSTESGPTPDHSSDSEPISNSGFEQRLAGFADWEGGR